MEFLVTVAVMSVLLFVALMVFFGVVLSVVGSIALAIFCVLVVSACTLLGMFWPILLALAVLYVLHAMFSKPGRLTSSR